MRKGIAVLLIACLGLTGCWLGGIGGQGGLSMSAISANSNDVATVQEEINTPVFRTLLARSAGVSVWGVRRLDITLRGSVDSWTTSRGVNQRVANSLSAYLSKRAEGHSPAYCRDAMVLGAGPQPSRHAFLNDIREREGPIPSGWISRAETHTNATGGRLTSFVVLDGEISWAYALSYNPDGGLRYCMSSRRDAVDLDPARTGLVAEVEGLVEARMKEEGSLGQFGSCHRFWQLKETMLKERGVRWRPPSDLNPNICFD